MRVSAPGSAAKKRGLQKNLRRHVWTVLCGEQGAKMKQAPVSPGSSSTVASKAASQSVRRPVAR